MCGHHGRSSLTRVPRFFVSLTVAASVPDILATFSTRAEATSTAMLGTFVVTAYVLGLATSPLLAGPLTDLHGRRATLRVSAVLFGAATAACGAAPSLGALVGLRFVAGCFGGVPAVVGGAVVADMYAEGERRGPMVAWSAGGVMAQMAGPVVGGALTRALGWRWAIWIPAIAVGCCCGCWGGGGGLLMGGLC